MAIRMRRGAYADFDPSRLLPGEWAVVLSNAPDAVGGVAAYMCFASGDVRRLATIEDLTTIAANERPEMFNALKASLEEAYSDIQAAERGRVTAENTRNSNENTRKANETARQTIESARQTAESNRVSAENGRVAAEKQRESNTSAAINDANDAAADARSAAAAVSKITGANSVLYFGTRKDGKTGPILSIIEG